MDEKLEKLKLLLESAEKILITSHISPDPDAICSILLMGTTLKANYPDKQIDMISEEKPSRELNFLDGYNDLKFQSVLKSIQSIKPDLMILLDGNNFDRCTRVSGAQIREQAKKGTLKTVAIDHHEEIDKDDFDIFINNHSPATSQDVYELCFEKLSLKKPGGYADTTLLGIVSDSNRFKYINPAHRKTFTIVSDLIDAGASIENLESRLERYSLGQMKIMAHLSENLRLEKEGYTYSFIDDHLIDEIQKKPEPNDGILEAADEFINRYIRNIEANLWGFIVFRDTRTSSSIYTASFRALGGVKDVSAIARKLGGGGHKPSAGAKFEASSVQEAIEKIKRAIESDN